MTDRRGLRNPKHGQTSPSSFSSYTMLQFFENIMSCCYVFIFVETSKLCYEPCFQWLSLVCLNYLCVIFTLKFTTKDCIIKLLKFNFWEPTTEDFYIEIAFRFGLVVLQWILSDYALPSINSQTYNFILNLQENAGNWIWIWPEVNSIHCGKRWRNFCIVVIYVWMTLLGFRNLLILEIFKE